ncbi:hypothetical protein B0H21DRAFT_159608 [Amylocystis lapponica]|nr:hypothetical protein B0H21DRAFT_159608 [Amylocystis lapponica]
MFQMPSLQVHDSLILAFDGSGSAVSTDDQYLRVESPTGDHLAASVSVSRNSTLPVNGLPHELLVDIFRIVRDTNRSTWSRRMVWIWLTHVCHYWRAVALSAPSLWDEIVVTSLPLLQTFIRRSRSTVLAITLPDAITNSAALATIITQHAPRIKTLNMLYNAVHSVIPHLKCQMSSVRNLVLETPYTNGYSTDEDELPDIYITKDQFPNLRSLSLTRFVLSWTSPLFTSLAHLHLIDLPDPEVSALLDIFAACPALETLSVCIAGLATYDDTPKTRMVTLPHVRKRFRTLRYLFQHCCST